MLNKSKVLDYFNSTELIKDNIHLVGCGSVGSHLAELFARQGVDKIHIYDFDTVDAHNITNQMFTQEQLGMPKVEAVTQLIKSINPDAEVIIHEKGLTKPYILDGYIFLCVDNIELRQAIVKANQYNPTVRAFFDFRTRLTDAQHYAAERTNTQQMKALLNSMDFTHDEVKETTPVSACGVELNVVDVIKVITSVGFANFRNYLMTDTLKSMALIDMQTLLFDVV